jgi:hypothetical protein
LFWNIAEQVLQQVFIQIWNTIDSYQPDEKEIFFTWMIKIARKQSNEYLYIQSVPDVPVIPAINNQIILPLAIS